MAEISFDMLNIYLKTEVPTNIYLKAFLFLFNLVGTVCLFWFAIALQEDKPNPFPFLLPVLYLLTLGKLIIWNIFGQEMLIISTTHISYQHNYGLWTTKLKTFAYEGVFADQSDSNIKTDDQANLIFIAFDEQRLQKTVFTTTIPLSLADTEKVLNNLNEMKIEEWGDQASFPDIFLN